MDIQYIKNIINKKINDNLSYIDEHNTTNAAFERDYNNLKSTFKGKLDILQLKELQNKIQQFKRNVANEIKVIEYERMNMVENLEPVIEQTFRPIVSDPSLIPLLNIPVTHVKTIIDS